MSTGRATRAPRVRQLRPVKIATPGAILYGARRAIRLARRMLWNFPVVTSNERGSLMSTTTLILLVILALVILGGGGGYYLRRR